MKALKTGINRVMLAATLGLATMATTTHAMPIGGPDMNRHEVMGEEAFHHRPGLPGALHRLDLSDTQKDQVFTLLHEQAPAMHEHLKTVRNAEKALDELLQSGNYSEAKAAPLLDAVATAQRQLLQQRVTTDARLIGVLTASQRDRLAQMSRKPPERH